MPKKFDSNIGRLIDANVNRAKEGLRVCEDFFRFVQPDKKLAQLFKKIRHQISDILNDAVPDAAALLSSRDVKTDSGRPASGLELRRGTCRDIFSANIKRAQESVRVLEEFCKLFSRAASVRLKEIRYTLYGAEKKAGEQFK